MSGTIDSTNLAPSKDQILNNLKRANQVASRAVSLGHHPFGATLVAPDHETVLLEQINLNTVEHAESVLARIAFNNYSSDFLWNCTLYTTVEPCVMCAGTQYWANIGRVVYGMSETRLLELTGDHSENPTMSLPCRKVFEHSQKKVEVIGPVEEVESEILEKHLTFWKH